MDVPLDSVEGVLRSLPEYHRAILRLNGLCCTGPGHPRCDLYAAKDGALTAIVELRRYGCPVDAWTVFVAAKNGHGDVVRLLESAKVPFDRKLCVRAAMKGDHLDVLRFVRGCNPVSVIRSAGQDKTRNDLCYAIRYRAIRCVRFLVEEVRMPFDFFEVIYAAGIGDPGVLDVLLSVPVEVSLTTLLRRAIRSGNAECVRRVLSLIPGSNQRVDVRAVVCSSFGLKSNHLDLAGILMEYGFSRDFLIGEARNLDLLEGLLLSTGRSGSTLADVDLQGNPDGGPRGKDAAAGVP